MVNAKMRFHLSMWAVVVAVYGLSLGMVSCRTQTKKIEHASNEITYRNQLYFLNTDRAYFGLSSISDKVHFVSGGFSKDHGYLNSTEFIKLTLNTAVSPAVLEAPLVAKGPNMSVKRAHHTSIAVPQVGKIVIMGGVNENLGLKNVLNDVEIYHVATDTLSMATPLMAARVFHTVNVLPNSKILVLGGEDGQGNLVPSTLAAELYDVSYETTSVITTTPRTKHVATTMSDGRILISGGMGMDGKALDSIEIYDPQSNTFSSVSAHLSMPRFSHSAVAVKKVGENEVVIFVGGISEELSGKRQVLENIEIYDVTQNKFFTSSQKLDDPVWGAELSVIQRSNDIEIVVTNGFQTLPDSSDFYSNQNLVASNENDLIIYHGVINNTPILSRIALPDSLLTYAVDGFKPKRFNGRAGHKTLTVINRYVLALGGISTECSANQKRYYCGGLDQANTMSFIDVLDTPTITQLMTPYDTLTKLGLAAAYLQEYGSYCLIDNKVYLNSKIKDPSKVILEYDADQVAFGLVNNARHYYLEGGNFEFVGGYHNREHVLFLGIDHLHVGHDTSGIRKNTGIRMASDSNIYTYPSLGVEFTKRILVGSLPTLVGRQYSHNATGPYGHDLGPVYQNVLLALVDTPTDHCATFQDP